MFDISWSEFLIVAIVALIFIGPKDLPAFFNTLGRYAGLVRRQAGEFRQYFEEAMREAELDQLKKEVEGVRDDVVGSFKDAHKAATVELDAVRDELKGVTAGSRFDAIAQLKDKGEVAAPVAAAIAAGVARSEEPKPIEQPEDKALSGPEPQPSAAVPSAAPPAEPEKQGA